MSQGYGYRKRPDPKAGLDPGAIALPKREWPRKIPLGIEGAGGGGNIPYEQQVIYLLGCDNDQPWVGIGSGMLITDYTGNATVTKTKPGWWAAINRSGYISNVLSTHATAIGFHRYGVRVNIAPQAWVDPEHPAMPAFHRIEDVICARMLSAGGDDAGGMNFGYSWENAVPPNGLTPYPYIGWQCEWTFPNTFGTWTANILDESGSVVASSASTATSEDPHHLAVELDGVTKAVRFYLDDALFYSVLPGAGAPFAQTFQRTEAHYAVMAQFGAEVQAMFLMDHHALVTVRAQDVEA